MLLAISTSLRAQDAEPARFVADAEARPISDFTASDAAPASTPLRWKSKSRTPTSFQPLAASQPIGSSQPIAHPEPVRLGWNVTRIDLSVKPAQALAPATGSDPFSDPFGDRQANHEGAPLLELQPTATEAGVEELPAPRAFTAPRRASPPINFNAASPEPAAPPAMIFEMAQPAPPSLPTPDIGPGETTPGRGVPCERIYNDRNCCESEENCTAFRNQLLSDSIRNISLDITPRYMPDLSESEDEATRLEKLNLLELRPWASRTGETIATGRLANYADGSVVIVDEGGQEVARIPWHRLGEDELCYLNAWWRLPPECTLGGLRNVERNWIPSTFAWHASGLCHKPLYFEDVQLERYGHTAGPYRQPVLSGAHFFLNIAALPYNMAINPPHECVYALGYYRPGSCAPWMIQPVPLSLRGALAEAGVIVGGVYLLP